MLICAIDQRTKRLLSQWMIVANVQEANITKMFEVYLESDKSQTTVSFIEFINSLYQKTFVTLRRNDY